MPKCPECKAAIDHLIAVAKEESKYIIRLENDTTLEYNYQQSIEGSTVETDFICPECEKSIYLVEENETQPDEVIRFLKGEVFPCNELCIHYVYRECITETGQILCDKPDDYKEVGDIADNLMNQRDDTTSEAE